MATKKNSPKTQHLKDRNRKPKGAFKPGINNPK